MINQNVGALADHAYRRIRQMILTGELEQGARLSQRGLAKVLGVSAMPVIEALRRLEQDGLVQRMHEFGAFVREWTAADIEEAFIIRRGLETEAARAMSLVATEAEKTTLLELSDLIDDAIRRNELGALVENELAFHLHLGQCARMPRLYGVLETTHAVVRSLYHWKGRADNLQIGLGDHRHIAEAIAAGDAERAVALVFEHITLPLNRFQEHQASVSAQASASPPSGPLQTMKERTDDDGARAALGLARDLCRAAA